MDDFRLAVDQLTETEQRFQYEASGDWWQRRNPEGDRAEPAVEQPFSFEVNARLVREDIVLAGKLAGVVGLECARCARRYSHPLHDEFRLVLEPVGDYAPPDPDGERLLAAAGLLLGEDLDTGRYRGNTVQLDDFFGEVIALALPIQPLCREDCPGICARCGVDLAETRCDCPDEDPGAKRESPFAVLAKLKGNED